MAYELITVKQLPALEEHFKEIGAEIDAKVTQCQNMVVTEDNYKDIKKIRGIFRGSMSFGRIIR